MSYRIMLLLSSTADPSLYQYTLEQSEEIQGVDVVHGDTKPGLVECRDAFKNGYSVVVTELVLSKTAIRANLDSYSAQVPFDGFNIVREGVARGAAEGIDANFVVLSEWDSPDHIYEAYRCSAKAFVSKKHPLNTGDLVQSAIAAAGGEITFPNMTPTERNISIGCVDNFFSKLSTAELHIVDLVVNELSTKQIKELLNSKSERSILERIAKVVRKLELGNRDDLFHHALQAGMVKYKSF